MHFNDYQTQARSSDRIPADSEIIVVLLGLAGEAGEVVSEYKKFLRDGNAYTAVVDRLEEELGDLLWYLSMVATRFGIDLERIAQRNLAKVRARWIDASGQIPLRPSFDASYPLNERLPERLVITITRAGDDRHALAISEEDGAQIGDILTDNSYAHDGYRFHDVFHFAYLAVLGWSPVVRKLLGRKRRSDVRVDEIEDGGRATAIEEAISAIVFDYAKQHNFFDGIVKVDHSLLKIIKSMTSHLEVNARSTNDWERAILDGYAAWRTVIREGSARIRIDRANGEVAVLRD